MGIFLNSGFRGFLASCKETISGFMEHFQDGFLGYGWKIWEYSTGKYKLTIDSITVRETMLIFDMLVSKIRALKGSLIISNGNGKIKFVETDDNNVYITLEDEDMSFVADDYLRCQTPDSNYWVLITEIDRKSVV